MGVVANDRPKHRGVKHERFLNPEVSQQNCSEV
jgi:hypothetical protein